MKSEDLCPAAMLLARGAEEHGNNLPPRLNEQLYQKSLSRRCDMIFMPFSSRSPTFPNCCGRSDETNGSVSGGRLFSMQKPTITITITGAISRHRLCTILSPTKYSVRPTWQNIPREGSARRTKRCLRVRGEGRGWPCHDSLAAPAPSRQCSGAGGMLFASGCA